MMQRKQNNRLKGPNRRVYIAGYLFIKLASFLFMEKNSNRHWIHRTTGTRVKVFGPKSGNDLVSFTKQAACVDTSGINK